MMISSKGKYALRVMIDLAEHNTGQYIAMREVAERQNISLKYLEKILPALVGAKLVEGVHGKGGGYRLTRDPSDYSVGEILRLSEGNLAPVSCLEEGAKPCSRSSECRVLPLWNNLDRMIGSYLDSVSLTDLMQSPKPQDSIDSI